MKKNTKIWIYPLIIFGFVIMLTSSCMKEESSSLIQEYPVLTTSALSDVTQATVTCGGNITDDGGATITAKGVCWGTTQYPTIVNNKTNEGTGSGSFTSNVTGLAANTRYHVRAYATNNTGTSYGNDLNFKTYTGSVTDIDGNVYYTITIDNQVWMAENLKTTRYRNGDPIPNINDDLVWDGTTEGAYCNYNNEESFSTTYGRLYNGYAVTDSRNIAPIGWHVASDSDWTKLNIFLGGSSVAGGKLKETGTIHWQSPNWGATNESGFTALAGGYRRGNGQFSDIGVRGIWFAGGTGYIFEIIYSDSDLLRADGGQTRGCSVRCIKD
jgi:uncharacterized protein (TIGR02145 family)